MKEEPAHAIPTLGPIKLSTHIADLFLAGAGEQPALNHPKTRAAWHLFFFSILALVGWHIMIRIAVIPAYGGISGFKEAIRMFEMVIYAYLIIVLCFLMYCHHRFMLIPRLSCRFRTLAFFMVLMVVLFSRLYYSLYHTNPGHFNIPPDVTLPTSEFGIHGTADLAGVLEFATLSGAIIVNSSYSAIQPKSVLACTIAIIEGGIGYIFIAILIATFVEITADRRTI